MKLDGGLIATGAVDATLRLWDPRAQAAAVGGARPLHRWASAQDAVPTPEDDGRPSFLKRQLAVSKQARGALSAAEAEAAAAEEEAAARRGFASPTKQQMGQVIAATEARVRAESQRELLIAEHTQLLQLCEKHSPGVLMAFRGRPLRDGLDAP